LDDIVTREGWKGVREDSWALETVKTKKGQENPKTLLIKGVFNFSDLKKPVQS